MTVRRRWPRIILFGPLFLLLFLLAACTTAEAGPMLTATRTPTHQTTSTPDVEATLTPVTVRLYWLVGEELEAERRVVAPVDDLPAATLRSLLEGPPPGNEAGWRTAIPTPKEVQNYPGRRPEWGDRVTLRGVTVEDGVAMADFSQEMKAYGGGSARVQAIRAQITRTLLQFPDIDEVSIAVGGETEAVLQP